MYNFFHVRFKTNNVVDVETNFEFNHFFPSYAYIQLFLLNNKNTHSRTYLSLLFEYKGKNN